MEKSLNNSINEVVSVIKAARPSFLFVGIAGASTVTHQLVPNSPVLVILTLGCIVGTLVGAYACKEVSK